MTDTRLPRHAGHTREMPLVGYRPRHDAEAPKPTNPHLAADGAKVHTWPLVGPSADPNPTGTYRVQHPPIPHPNVTVEPAMTQAGAAWMRNVCMALAGAVAVVAVVLAVVAVVTP